jgi:hypothetical protein
MKMALNKGLMKTPALAAASDTRCQSIPDQESEQESPKEIIDKVTKDFKYATSLLKALGLDPPSSRSKSKEAVSTAVRANLLTQFDTKDIEPEWREEYIKLIM